MKVRTFAERDTDAIIALWKRCGLVKPWNDPYRDIQRKMSVQPELFLVGDHHCDPIASVMGGYDGHRGWVYYLAVEPSFSGRGLGTNMLRELEVRLLAMGCPKVNLQVRSENAAVLSFYQAAGYGDDYVVSMGKRLISDG